MLALVLSLTQIGTTEAVEASSMIVQAEDIETAIAAVESVHTGAAAGTPEVGTPTVSCNFVVGLDMLETSDVERNWSAWGYGSDARRFYSVSRRHGKQRCRTRVSHRTWPKNEGLPGKS